MCYNITIEGSYSIHKKEVMQMSTILFITTLLSSISITFLFLYIADSITEANNAKARYYNLLADDLEAKHEKNID